eukprot:gene3143-5459_t
MSFNIEEWDYRGEGAQNVVVGYTGNEEKFKHKVMRLTKIEKTKKQKNSERKLHVSEYLEKVISKIIDPKFIVKGLLVEIDSEFIEKLDNKILEQRPFHRRFKKLDENSKFAIILSDLTFVDCENEDVFSVEIKPKWGILCESKYIRDDFKPHKYQYCRYCMHQFLKLKQVNNQKSKIKNDIERISDYCPIDLFSNKYDRMWKAISGLIENPQNNFRFFVNNHEIPTLKIEDHIDKKIIIEKLINILKETQILQEIQKIQFLDEYDIEFVHKIYENYCEEISCVFEDQIDEMWVNVIKEKLKNKYPKEFHCGNDNIVSFNLNKKFESEFEELKKNKEKIVQILREYLISHTFKDCSVMISFPKSFKSYNIGLVDLDPKLASKIPKYEKLDGEIVINHINTSFSK